MALIKKEILIENNNPISLEDMIADSLLTVNNFQNDASNTDSNGFIDYYFADIYDNRNNNLYRIYADAVGDAYDLVSNDNKYLYLLIDNENNSTIDPGTLPGGENGTYTGTAGIDVGGIKAGDTFEDVPVSVMIDNIINPELFPTLTNPSNSLTSNISGLVEIGTSIAPKLTATFNRGSINPKYNSLDSYRSGLPEKYKFTSTKGLDVNIDNNNLSLTYDVPSFNVEIGTITFSSNVSYSVGTQPKSNKNNNFNTPLVPGTTGDKTITITGVYPCYSGIDTLNKLLLANHGGIITVDAPIDMNVSGERFKIQYPVVWSAKTPIVQQENELSKAWDNQSMSDYTVSDITVNGVAYKQVSYIGAGIGARKLRLVF